MSSLRKNSEISSKTDSSTVVNSGDPEPTIHYSDENQAYVVYPNGDVYEGAFKHKRRNGYGIMTYSSLNNNGNQNEVITYEGEWKNDLRHGYGVQNSSNNL